MWPRFVQVFMVFLVFLVFSLKNSSVEADTWFFRYINFFGYEK